MGHKSKRINPLRAQPHKDKSNKKMKRMDLVDRIRHHIMNYKYYWVISWVNLRNNFLKQMRRDLTHSRFHIGKNKIVQIGLGGTQERLEPKPKLHQFSKWVVGEVGLLFTNEEPEIIQKYFDDFQAEVFARTGTIADHDVILPAGIVCRGPNQDECPGTMDPGFRQSGMPTRVVKGKVWLDNQYTVCREGDNLTSNQAHLLKQLGIKTAEFKITLLGYYTEGKIVKLADPPVREKMFKLQTTTATTYDHKSAQMVLNEMDED